MRSKIWGHLSHPRTCDQLSRPQAGPLKLILLLWNGHPLTAKWDPPLSNTIILILIIIIIIIIIIQECRMPTQRPLRYHNLHAGGPVIDQDENLYQMTSKGLFALNSSGRLDSLGLAWTPVWLSLGRWSLVAVVHRIWFTSGRSEVTCCGTMKRLEGPTMR